ncbi:RDD family protein [Nocardioides sp. Soil805]|uniref:RDD family protein n=1 Tax=Nocardioides sp. Soil805 TaxID=1736416 RepID=UPI000A60FF74|nr:RDD family protein [Nocardioides sp. Soil805]
MTRPELSSVPVEARAFQGHAAGLVTRSIAAALDAVVVGLLMLAGYLGLNGLLFLVDPRGFTVRDPHLLLSLAVAWGVAVVYLTACWALTGRSYGCHVMGLSVLDHRGRRPHLVTALVRAAFCAFVPIGLLWCGVSRTNRSLQDLVLRTRVVYDWIPHDPEVHPRSSQEDDAESRHRGES